MRTRDPDKTEASLGSRDLVVEQVPVSSLKPYANNPRTHTKKQIRQIAELIKTFGWMNPVLVDANDRIIAGHGRVEAAKCSASYGSDPAYRGPEARLSSRPMSSPTNRLFIAIRRE